MNGTFTWKKKWQRWFGSALVALGCTAQLAQAQDLPPSPPQNLPSAEAPPTPAAVNQAAPTQVQDNARLGTPSPAEQQGNVQNAGGNLGSLDTGLKQTGCCGQNRLAPSSYGCGAGGCGSGYGCGGNKCIPGRFNCCSDVDRNTFCGRLFGGFYDCLCCPDPCYDPCWNPAANAAFWTDFARPVTITRFRYDAGFNFLLPDRAEYFFARSDGKGRGPNLNANPSLREGGIRYDQLNLYQEVAAKGFSVFFEVPYLSVDEVGSGFGDMNVGTKALLFDCELLQLTFQFRTYLPVGSPGKGLGTGHVSLEPSLLAALKLTSSTYFQSQVSEWIPIAGDPDYAGSILHYHASLNQVIYRFLPDMPLIGTMEFNGYSYQDGAFTDRFTGIPQRATGNTYMNAGPGLRLSICDRVDFGFSAVFSINSPGPEQIYRSELRIRF